MKEIFFNISGLFALALIIGIFNLIVRGLGILFTINIEIKRYKIDKLKEDLKKAYKILFFGVEINDDKKYEKFVTIFASGFYWIAIFYLLKTIFNNT